MLEMIMKTVGTSAAAAQGLAEQFWRQLLVAILKWWWAQIERSRTLAYRAPKSNPRPAAIDNATARTRPRGNDTYRSARGQGQLVGHSAKAVS